jgi:hypothetical protein
MNGDYILLIRRNDLAEHAGGKRAGARSLLLFFFSFFSNIRWHDFEKERRPTTQK